MTLYHGTNLDFDKIDLYKCKPYKDFGKGFYTTTLPDQAQSMAIKKSRIYGGEPCVISYNAPDDLLSFPALKIKIFDKATQDWAVFIINNRNRDFSEHNNLLCNTDNKYDIVYGPVANDTLTTLIQRYTRGYIDTEILLKEMEYVAPNNQYSFHSQAAVSALEKVGVKWIK
ncbi:MAG: DUF3990 domain-containing protein [Roseburia sp.]|nr:DUF3990 domain-containing protein [Roseburia sp.]